MTINNLLLDWMQNLDDGEIPKRTPICLSSHNSTDLLIDFISEYGNDPRGFATSRGMWALVDLTWTDDLAHWIGSREVIEVMAGAGWLAKALNIHGVKIIATDNLSWNGEKTHRNIKPVYEIKEFEGIRAVDEFCDADILLCSWPPYGRKSIIKICKAWGGEKPIIYIGEDQGGCNAPDDFFDAFQVIKEMNVPQHYGLHDICQIGYFRI